MKQYKQYDLEGVASRWYTEPYFIYDTINLEILAKPGPRRRSIALLIGKDESIVIAASICHFRDHFERKEGRFRVENRAKGMILRNMKDNAYDTSSSYPAAYFSSLADLQASGDDWQEVVFYAPLPMDQIVKIIKRHLEWKSDSDKPQVSVTVVAETTKS